MMCYCVQKCFDRSFSLLGYNVSASHIPFIVVVLLLWMGVLPCNVQINLRSVDKIISVTI